MTVKYCPISGKQSYATRNDAERALKAIQSKPARRRSGAGCYLCELGCGHFHITAHINSRAKQRKADLRRAEQ